MILRTWFRYVLLLLWMGLIFWSSATPDLRAVPVAQRLGFLPELLGPGVTRFFELLLRKSAHVLAFGTLAALARHALSSGFPRVAPHRHGYLAFYVAVLYAVSDEWHQSFVPTRDARVVDVFIDAAGAAAALLLWRFFERRRSLERGESV